jgi:hypothetical protein
LVIALPVDQHGAPPALTQAGPHGTNDSMSMLDSVKEAVVGQAMRLMSDPRVSRLMGDQRVMNVAMKAVGVGGSIKAELDRASRFAAGLFGLATQEEVSALRSTIQTLEDNLAIIESKTAASTPGAIPPASAS